MFGHPGRPKGCVPRRTIATQLCHNWYATHSMSQEITRKEREREREREREESCSIEITSI